MIGLASQRKNSAIPMDMKPNRFSLGRNPLSDAPYRNPGMVLNEQGLGRHRLSGAPYRNPGVVLNKQGPDRHRLSGALHLCSDVVLSEQRSLHLSRRMRRARKLAEANRLRVGSWNVGSLTGKLRELMDAAIRRRVNILCVQETRWAGQKAREVENTGIQVQPVLGTA